MTETKKRHAKKTAGELVVPAMMLLCVGIYWAQAAGLSTEAVAFPLALTSVIVLANVIVVTTSIISMNKTEIDNTKNVKDRKGDIILSVKTWMIVLTPIPLIYFWRDLGAIPVFLLYATGILFFLGERKPLWLVLVPSFLSVSLFYLFKTVLYVRLPDIPWAFGG